MGAGDVNAEVVGAVTSHRLAVLRYEGGTVRRLLEVYDTALAGVVAELAAARKKLLRGEEVDDRRREVLTALSADLRRKIATLHAAASLTLSERAAEVAEAERLFADRRLSRIVGLSLVAVPDAAVAAAIVTPIGGAAWRSRLALDLVAVESSLQAGIAQALARGLSMPRAAALLRHVGVVETYRDRLVAIARTEIQRVANAVALDSYARSADVVGSVQVLATLDSRTCPVCGSLHDEVYPLVNGRPQGLERIPPFHPRCRCFLAPVVKSWRDLGLTDTADNRAAYTGAPTTSRSFEDWLRSRPPEEADEVFGPTRAAAWRAGRLSIDEMVRGLRALSLGELRALYPDAV